MADKNLPDYLRKYADVASADAQSMAAASISVPRISLKGKKFQFKDGDDESKRTDAIDVTILAVTPEGSRMIKTYYAGGYNSSDNSPPDCSSSNGIQPDDWVTEPISRTCAQCPMNAFGSAKSANGKPSKACRDSKRLWVAKPDDIEGTVYALGVPVTSLRNMATYGKEIASMGAPLQSVITRIEMNEDSEFPLLEFSRMAFLNEEFGVKAIERGQAREWITDNVSKQLAGPSDTASLPNRSAPASTEQAEIDESTIEGTARTVSKKSIDEAAESW